MFKWDMMGAITKYRDVISQTQKKAPKQNVTFRGPMH